jgi:hypothetical protein
MSTPGQTIPFLDMIATVNFRKGHESSMKSPGKPLDRQMHPKTVSFALWIRVYLSIL